MEMHRSLEMPSSTRDQSIGSVLARHEVAVRLLEVTSRLDELLKEREDNRVAWLKSPVLVAVATAMLGLLGTGAGVLLQGYSNAKLERQKFEAALIRTALEPRDQAEVARNLVFLLDTGIIQSLDHEKIAAAAAKPATLPVGFGVLHGGMTIIEAKRLLSQLGLYHGPQDETDDQVFRNAVRIFQQQQDMPGDGMLGLLTSAALRNAAPSRLPTPP